MNGMVMRNKYIPTTELEKIDQSSYSNQESFNSIRQLLSDRELPVGISSKYRTRISKAIKLLDYEGAYQTGMNTA